MNKHRFAQLAMVATAVPAVFVANSGVASAAGGQQAYWKNVATGKCLTYRAGINQPTRDVETSTPCSRTPVSSYRWLEEQASDGTWAMRTEDGRCLTSYGSAVYLEDCSADVNATNWYQRWWEVSSSRGWKLKSRMSGLYLDSNSDGGVYTHTENDGNYQLWK
ncbi:hypothetical protein DWB77_07339 [Streptomyces hundungensis]|uniref:Uncharacterized protein n=1 Tax=Streptomyces hundungensis TaxID=1077946 RepID=A0A387HQQ0_9ACTN|nr:ricin-type beta-trefoil lectin domain protein [Streptomyces hundungensis]AYG85123.1 hypothetical protein DWB77_07339 [Streptomyces hundungensis]